MNKMRDSFFKLPQIFGNSTEKALSVGVLSFEFWVLSFESRRRGACPGLVGVTLPRDRRGTGEALDRVRRGSVRAEDDATTRGSDGASPYLLTARSTRKKR
jgi:hypothetical protein